MEAHHVDSILFYSVLSCPNLFYFILFYSVTFILSLSCFCYCSNVNVLEQSPSWEDNSHSASQETTRFLWKPKVNYLVHKGPPATGLYPVADASIPHSHILFP